VRAGDEVQQKQAPTGEWVTDQRRQHHAKQERCRGNEGWAYPEARLEARDDGNDNGRIRRDGTRSTGKYAGCIRWRILSGLKLPASSTESYSGKLAQEVHLIPNLVGFHNLRASIELTPVYVEAFSKKVIGIGHGK